MSYGFGRATVEDVDGTDTSVEVTSLPNLDGPTKLVELATFSGTSRFAPVFLEPGAARALARALDEAADEADLQALEEAV